MSDTFNRLYEEIIRCTILNENTGSVDVALFYHNNQNLLRMGLAETWKIKNT